MATVQVEIYNPLPSPARALDPERVIFDDADKEIREIEAARRITLAKELGLTAVVRTTLRMGTLQGAVVTIPYPLLTAEEVRVWYRFLPTVYSTQMPVAGTVLIGQSQVRDMKDYAFDQPPISVLEAWKAARDQKLFDTYEIRTPEAVQRPDPILLGWKHHTTGPIGPFLIARWGEALQDFAEIKKAVAAGGATLAAMQQQMSSLQRFSQPSLSWIGASINDGISTTFPMSGTISTTGTSTGFLSSLGSAFGLHG